MAVTSIEDLRKKVCLAALRSILVLSVMLIATLEPSFTSVTYTRSPLRELILPLTLAFWPFGICFMLPSAAKLKVANTAMQTATTNVRISNFQTCNSPLPPNAILMGRSCAWAEPGSPRASKNDLNHNWACQLTYISELA